LPRQHIVEVHRATGAAEAPGNRVVGAHRLVRRLECPQPDALVAAADLGVERVVRARADTSVAGARAAAFQRRSDGARKVGRRGARRVAVERGGQRSERHAGGWEVSGRLGCARGVK
jgi:hypothetical protein